MNCWLGVCRYLEENGKCQVDEKECDFHRVNGSDACHCENNSGIILSCERVCKWYNGCTEK